MQLIILPQVRITLWLKHFCNPLESQILFFTAEQELYCLRQAGWALIQGYLMKSSSDWFLVSIRFLDIIVALSPIFLCLNLQTWEWW